jgi:hypothetical protein
MTQQRLHTIKCPVCAVEFTPFRKNTKFCNHRCAIRPWQQTNKEFLSIKRRWRYLKNRKEINIRSMLSRKKNWDMYKAKCRQRYKNNTNHRLSNVLRRRLGKALQNNQKIGSAIKNLGCTISEFKEYLESKFQPGMTWDNYGQWHIDHIKPLSKFDLTDLKQLKKVCHYSNLQPLWAKDNLRKGNKL